MKMFRIYNASIDILIRADDTVSAVEKFAKEHPDLAHLSIMCKEVPE